MSKYKHFKSNIHEEFDNCNYITLTIENPNMNDVDSIFYSYITEHNRKFDYFLKKCQLKIVFNDYQFCPYITSDLSDNNLIFYWYKLLENEINNFIFKGYNFNHKAEMNNITIANKLVMSNDFYIKPNIHAV